MTYGGGVGNEVPDDIWTQQVQGRNAESALHGLHTMHKAEQQHPSEHNGAAMPSAGERMSAMTVMRNMLPLAIGAAAAGHMYQARQEAGRARHAAYWDAHAPVAPQPTRLDRQLNRDIGPADSMGRNVGRHANPEELWFQRGRIAIGATPQGARHRAPPPAAGHRRFDQRDFVGRPEL